MTASRPPFSAQTDIECAASSFAHGVLAALAQPREFYEIKPIYGAGIGSYERQRHCDREIARIQHEDRLATLDRCEKLAALACLAGSLTEIAGRRDILELSEAA